MTKEVGVDYPGDREVLDVFTVSVDESMTSVVHRSGPDDLVVEVGQTHSGRRVRLDPGERLQVVWRGPETLRGVPVELTAVHMGEEPTWDLRIVGPSTQVQRRDAVRAPLRLEVRISAGGDEQPGYTVDVSEGGLRCLMAAPPTNKDGTEQPTAAGDAMQLTLSLGDGVQVSDRVELVRKHHRTDKIWEVSVRFTGLSERQQDTIRAKVFAELRALRAAGLM